MKKKSNWWVILAILIIGIPVGYVATGLFGKLADKESSVANGDSLTKQKVENTDSISSKTDTTEVQKQNEPEKEPKDAVEDKANDNPAAKKQEPTVNQPQMKKQNLQKTEEQLRIEAEKAEQRRLQKEEQKRIKEANAEKLRLQREEQARIKKEKAEQQRLQREEQARVKKEKEVQLRIERERKAEEARQKKAEENRRKAELAEQKKREAAEAAEKKRKEAEAIAEQKKNELKAEVQKIVASGRKSAKVPDGCTIVVNGRNTTDYQAFRMGVNYKAYSNVVVKSVNTDTKGNITRIAVSATESKDAD